MEKVRLLGGSVISELLKRDIVIGNAVVRATSQDVQGEVVMDVQGVVEGVQGNLTNDAINSVVAAIKDYPWKKN